MVSQAGAVEMDVCRMELCSHLHMSSGDLQGRVVWVTARQLRPALPPLHPPLKLCLPPPALFPPLQHFPKEALKLDTLVERLGGLFKIRSQAVLGLAESKGRRNGEIKPGD